MFKDLECLSNEYMTIDRDRDIVGAWISEVTF